MVRLLPSSRSSVSMVIAWAGQTWRPAGSQGRQQEQEQRPNRCQLTNGTHDQGNAFKQSAGWGLMQDACEAESATVLQPRCL